MVTGDALDVHFDRFEAKLRAEFEMLRGAVDHPGERGALVEQGFLRVVEDHIPEGFGVTTGFVVDCHGSISQQIDIIIYSKSTTPFVFRDTISLIPIECVICALEVKSNVDSAAVKDATAKSASIRRLRRDAYVDQMIELKDSTTDNRGRTLLSFLLVGLTSVSPETLRDAFMESVHSNGSDRILVDQVFTIMGASASLLEDEAGRNRRVASWKLPRPATMMISSINFGLSRYRPVPIQFERYARFGTMPNFNA